MRELFLSEQRYIRNVLFRHRNIETVDFGLVVAEHYSPPRVPGRTRFNNDFMLRFVDELRDFKSCCARVLPNTLGAEVFVTYDESSSRPLMTELLAGEAFAMKYFTKYINAVEDRLAALSHPIKLRKVSYCRIFVIENDICFLAFPNDFIPVMRGRRRLLCSSTESSIACSKEGTKTIYVDGWIRTFVADNDQRLEAIADTCLPDG